jgi:alkylation response protein AidB-like acyl-CoA dehydrogenase
MRRDDADNADEAIAALMARIAPAIDAARARATDMDQASCFPRDDVAALTDAGALAAVVPTLLGGLGIGTEPARSAATAAMLHLIGSASIALGRIYEGHINAIRLVMLHGTARQRHDTAADARAGHLHALWVTDGAAPLAYARSQHDIVLRGEKQFCSAAGHATRAVVTAAGADGKSQMLLLPLGQHEIVQPLAVRLQGVRSAGTGRVCFDAVRHGADAQLGGPDTYLREPEFSAGAWRASAVTAGGVSALVEATRSELVARGRDGAPEQRERLGRMFINAQAARLWLLHIAPIAEDPDRAPEHATASVNLGRIAIEAACVNTMQLAQRCLGLSAFLVGNPVERICRDLATYLRQPAPDEALRDAAGHFAANPHGYGLS